MARSDLDPIIVGGGLAGSLAALAMARRRPELDLLLVERGERFGGNHIWSFFDRDVAGRDRWLVEPSIASRWPSYEIHFPRRSRTLPTGYNSLRSSLLDRQVRSSLREDQYRLGAAIRSLSPQSVTFEDGECLSARAVIDARGAANLAALDLGWQKFVGRELKVAGGHGLDRPVVMDACVDQTSGYRFIYLLPFDSERLLVEDTYYSTKPGLDRATIAAEIEAYCKRRGWRIESIEHEEQGVLPVAMGGDFERFWPAGDGLARIGLRGGFFHPTTGYSLPDAVRTATLAASTSDLKTLPSMLRAEANRLWRKRGFYRLLNRMLFRAAQPPERYRVLEHFYRLDAAVIARFYAAQSTLADRFRILSGRPPVPVVGAVRSLLQ